MLAGDIGRLSPVTLGISASLRRRLRCACCRLGVFIVTLLFSGVAANASLLKDKQQSLDAWRRLTASAEPAARAYAKGDNVRIYFSNETGVVEFQADWKPLRVPSPDYRINSAILRRSKKPSPLPEAAHGWREAIVVAGAAWQRLTTNVIEEMTPRAPDHGIYYQTFLADGFLYRDGQGVRHSAALGLQPADLVVEQRYSIDETIDVMARSLEKNLVRAYPAGSLFLLLPTDGQRLSQPLLLDRDRHQCVCLAPAALYDSTDRALDLTFTARSVSALLIEGHGVALIKNPVSSAARLANMGVETLVRLFRTRMPSSTNNIPPLAHSRGMNLQSWEKWLDRYTGTHREAGSLKLLIDGNRFFPRFRQALAEATNRIDLEVFIFDRDDVAVGIADELKQLSRDVKVKVLLDRLGSLAAGVAPPATPLPVDFVPPTSISSYLKKDSNVKVRSFLNPWITSDHSKMFLVDGRLAWLGGMNFGREYRHEWHDLMVEVQGPVVASFEEEFKRHWAHESLMGDLAYALRGLGELEKSPPANTNGDWIPVRRLPTRTGWHPFGNAVLKAFRKAQSYIYVENPYLFDKRVIIELVKARRRGVDVRVVLPRFNDLEAGNRSNIVTANYLHRHGVRVYFYPGMTHVKALLVDGWACLGSANLDHFSLRINQEENIATSDPTFSEELKHDLFEEDFAHSYKLTKPISVDWTDFLADQILAGF